MSVLTTSVQHYFTGSSSCSNKAEEEILERKNLKSLIADDRKSEGMYKKPPTNNKKIWHMHYKIKIQEQLEAEAKISFTIESIHKIL